MVNFVWMCGMGIRVPRALGAIHVCILYACLVIHHTRTSFSQGELDRHEIGTKRGVWGGDSVATNYIFINANYLGDLYQSYPPLFNLKLEACWDNRIDSAVLSPIWPFPTVNKWVGTSEKKQIWRKSLLFVQTLL